MKLFGLTTFLLLSCNLIVAQSPPAWEHKFSGEGTRLLLKNKQHRLAYFIDGGDILAYDYFEREELWRRSDLDVDKLKLITKDSKTSKITLAKNLKSYEINGFQTFPILPFEGVSTLPSDDRGYRKIFLNAFTGETVYDEATVSMPKIISYHRVNGLKGMIVKGIENKQRVYGYVEFGKPGLRWQKDLPVELKRITLRDNFRFGPIGDDNTLVQDYAGLLYGIDAEDGEMLWETPANEFKRKGSLLRLDYQEEDGTFLRMPWVGDHYEMERLTFRDTQSVWKAPVKLRRRYKVKKHGTDKIFAETGPTFNSYDFETGAATWAEPAELTGTVKSVTAIEGNFLVATQELSGNFIRPDTTLRFHLLDGQQTAIWKEPIEVAGTKMVYRRLHEGTLYYQTNEVFGAAHVATGTPVGPEFEIVGGLSTIDLDRGDLISVGDKKIYRTSFATGETEKLLKKYKLKGDDEFFREIRIIDNNYVFISDRNLLLVDQGGTLLRQDYYRKPGISTKLLNTVISAAAIIGGALFREEMVEINRALYESELIDPEDYFDGAIVMGAYGDFGSALVGGAYAQRFLTPSNPKVRPVLRAMDNVWLVADKFERGSFGIRVIDITSGRELNSMKLGDSMDFPFQFDPMLGGMLLYNAEESTLQFFNLLKSAK